MQAARIDRVALLSTCETPSQLSHSPGDWGYLGGASPPARPLPVAPTLNVPHAQHWQAFATLVAVESPWTAQPPIRSVDSEHCEGR
jgi:hypothetical protein